MSLYAGDQSWGSNSALKIVRDAIAEALGVDRAEHWNPRMTNDTLMGYWHDPVDSVFSVPSSEVVDDPIDYLMLHQDCEGILPAFTIPALAERLSEILPNLNDEVPWTAFNPRRQVEGLLELLVYAADNGLPVTFSG